MAINITDQTTTIKFDLGNDQVYHIDKSTLSIKKRFGKVAIFGDSDAEVFTKFKFRYSEVATPVSTSNDDLIAIILSYKVSTATVIGNVQITDGSTTLKIEPNGSMPVTLQDQTTPVVIVPFNRITNSTTITAPTVVDAYTITVASTTGFIDGGFIGLHDDANLLVWFGYQVGAPAGNVITVDRPIDAIFPTSGTEVDVGDTNMNVDGSSTTQTFSVRPHGTDFPVSIDITRIIITIYTDTAVDLVKFGDLARLSKGVTLRKTDGENVNIMNWKSNGELAGMCFDMNFYASTNPSQGQDGLAARLTFAGQSKMGVTVRIGQDEDLELLINDDLTDLAEFKVIAEGSLVLS